MYYDKLIQVLIKRVEDIRESQSQLDEELLYTETWLDKFIDSMDSVNKCLKQIESQKTTLQPQPTTEKAYRSEEDFKAQLEKLLQGPLEALGDKISERILNMLKELKGMAGPVREAGIRKIKEAAASELVDLSKLFLHEKVESNIQDTGVEEKEAKGIDKSLKRLQKMREGKTGKDGKGNGEKSG